MDDFELPEGFDEAQTEENVAFEEPEDVTPAPIYVEPTGMDAMAEIAGDDGELTAFNKEWQASIDKKAADELALASKEKAEAEADLMKWRNERSLRLKAKAENNRSEEAVVVEGLQVEGPEKAAWSRVLKLVDAVSDSPAAGKSDTSKMHSLFIQLKNEPLAA